LFRLKETLALRQQTVRYYPDQLRDTTMPEPKSAFEDLDEDIEARAIAEAEAEIDSGKGVPHAKVRKWLLKLVKGEVVPPPCK